MINKKILIISIGLFIVGGILGYFISKLTFSCSYEQCNRDNKCDVCTQIVSVPVAKITIQPKTLITDDMVSYVNVPSVYVSKNVIESKGKIIGKYSNYNTIIPAGSMFYSETLITKDKLPDAALMDLSEGEILYNFPVTMETTYQNSIMPGTKIDIYMKAINDSGVLIVGKLLENINVLAVKTSGGLNVFEDSSIQRTPAYIFFGVSSEIHILLRKAAYLKTNNVELYPVPHGTNYVSNNETMVSSEELKAFIDSHTVNL